ncbi:hypothetical protein I4F81_003410 [Pyropia yezoensis]|uniref:Uncharacterized protein n=1 Tax=Pyropia yezoensis TaxID=2788 RepID=A0ACC3BS40_PYRYE|nr:hypothetical protein I4F81_003410 [Neopyropia yezoensis]
MRTVAAARDGGRRAACARRTSIWAVEGVGAWLVGWLVWEGGRLKRQREGGRTSVGRHRFSLPSLSGSAMAPAVPSWHNTIGGRRWLSWPRGLCPHGGCPNGRAVARLLPLTPDDGRGRPVTAATVTGPRRCL